MSTKLKGKFDSFLKLDTFEAIFPFKMRNMNRKTSFILTILLSSLIVFSLLPAHAQRGKTKNQGYEIKVEFKEAITDQSIALAKYFGQGYPTVYKIDNAEVKNGKTAVFSTQDSILGGFYIVLFNDNQQFFEIILNNGDKMEILVDQEDFPKKLQFKNSPENNMYIDYINKVAVHTTKQKSIQDQLAEAKNETDSAKLWEQFNAETNKVTALREAQIEKHPNSFLSKVFAALAPVKVPEGHHYLEDGKTIDSTFAYRYNKKHYWDGFDFKDERLIHSPILDNKLEEYFTRMVVPTPDSVIYEADILLAKPAQDKELFKYTLHYMTKFAEGSKYMGLDEAFVYFVENYHMQGKAYWMDQELLDKFQKRAEQISPTVLGKVSHNMSVNDAFTLKAQNLHDFEGEQTLLIFWDPTCGACKKEIPLLRDLYNETLKDKGVKVFSVILGGDLESIQKSIINNKIEHWNNYVITKNPDEIQENFDAYSTPKIYFLGKDKEFVGKRLSSENLLEFYNIYEKGNNK